MKPEEGIRILSEASRGILTMNHEFKLACEMGKNAIQLWTEHYDSEHPHVHRVKPAILGQKFSCPHLNLEGLVDPIRTRCKDCGEEGVLRISTDDRGLPAQVYLDKP